MWCRLTGQYDRLTANDATDRAESTLGWTSHYAYFYVGRPHPDYGSFVQVHRAPDAGVSGWAVSPFDTGGMVKEGDPRIRTTVPKTIDQRVSLVQKWSWGTTQYVSLQRAWIDDAYPTYAGYVTGESPGSHLVPEVAITGNDSHAWTWEGRLPALSYAVPPLALHRLFTTHDEIKAFRRWVAREGVIPRERIGAWMRALHTQTHETSTPYQDATASLV